MTEVDATGPVPSRFPGAFFRKLSANYARVPEPGTADQS
jgi:hypothetical protein